MEQSVSEFEMRVHTAYAVCQKLARHSHSSFLSAISLLPEEQRKGMTALYAFMRHTDDIADAEGMGLSTGPSHPSVSEREMALLQWEQQLHEALDSETDYPATQDEQYIILAAAETIKRFSIPVSYFSQCIRGVMMDVYGRIYLTTSDMEDYCYHVAGSVGLASLCIWGVPVLEGTREYAQAVACGHALQVTNILRDIREDAHRGRVYFPESDLKASGISRSQVLAFFNSELKLAPGDSRKIQRSLLEVVRVNEQRARGYYAQASGLEEHIPQSFQPVYKMIVTVYKRILDHIGKNPSAVLYRRVRLSWYEKLILFLFRRHRSL